MQPLPMQPFAIWNPACGVWETTQFDLSGRLAPFSETWPTSGTTRHGSAYPLPLSARRIPDSACSSSPVPLLRTPLGSDSSRGGETLEQVRARRGTIALSHQVIDLTLNGPDTSNPRTGESGMLWPLIESIFEHGEDTPPPSRDGSTSPARQPQLPR
ncbi:hypothetical protein MUN76_05965 [Leucobacter rhizosphaerae]|uniref:Uncharacterized protein n=1 Tax=Leucobacter rhizosphaerae TaxID=2932245 RepID=A0ABY4G046_9MICO|nr:hypothetical protein [Leucobacter rhizosphaerae]UOQ61952.1 hypothetical protein MUN76_05965 [Leucobacter rhizosphaerae]